MSKIINNIRINFYNFLCKLSKKMGNYFELKFINAVIKAVRDEDKEKK